MVQVSSIQAQTISAGAVAHLTSTNPIQIPGNTLTQPVATALNALITAQMKPVLAQVRASLGLHVRHRTIGGTPVAVITPRRIGRKRRRAAGFFAPAVDLRALGDSYVANDGRDPLVTRDAITKFMAAYLGATSATDPDASPVLADYSDGFVPTVLTTGTRDLLQSDSMRFYRTLRSAGVPVRLRVWEGMRHAFEGVPNLPEGGQAMREVFDFLEKHL